MPPARGGVAEHVHEPSGGSEYLFGWMLKAHKGYHLKADNGETEHQLPLRKVSLGAGAKVEFYIPEAEAMN